MSTALLPTGPSVAVIGAGIAGAACAASLLRSGCRVTVFDKSRGVGGRMATRRLRWCDADGAEHEAAFDHGAQQFSARHPRFRACVGRAVEAGVVSAWQPRVHRSGPVPFAKQAFVARPGMPALCRHLLAGVPVLLEQSVQRLQRGSEGWRLVIDGGESVGPFDQVMLAMPPAQAALLLAGHHDGWADHLASLRMDPCWTLMAVTDEVDWPWDAAEPPRGPLAWIARDDRKPGRRAPDGRAVWVAQATAAWSAAHLEEDPAAVADALRDALAALLPARWSAVSDGRWQRRPVHWHHASVHRWRYALPAALSTDPATRVDCWWDAARGLGVCGDFLGGGGVEAAWRSGDELRKPSLPGWSARSRRRWWLKSGPRLVVRARFPAPVGNPGIRTTVPGERSHAQSGAGRGHRVAVAAK